MAISNEISHLYDNYHIDSLYRVCRFCFNRISSKDLQKESIRKPLTQLVVERAEKYFQINFKLELSEITMFVAVEITIFVAVVVLGLRT